MSKEKEDELQKQIDVLVVKKKKLEKDRIANSTSKELFKAVDTNKIDENDETEIKINKWKFAYLRDQKTKVNLDIIGQIKDIDNQIKILESQLKEEKYKY